MQVITQAGAFTDQIRQQINQNFAQMGGLATGNYYYCDPQTGSDSNNGQQPVFTGQPGYGPVQSLAAGYALMAEGNNDVLVLIGNGLSTGSARLSAGFTWAKDAAHLMGVCPPSPMNARARIAPATGATAFANFFTLTGKGCMFANVSFFQGFATGTTNQICFTLTASNNSFYNCGFLGMGDTQSAVDTGSRSLVITGDENYFSNCQIGLDTIVRTVLNSTIEFKGGSARNVFENCIFPALSSTSAACLIVLGAATAVLDRFTLFRRCTFWNASTFSGGAAATGAIKLLASSGGGIMLDNCTEYGFTTWGYDAASKAQIVVSGAVPTGATSGIAIVNS